MSRFFIFALLVSIGFTVAAVTEKRPIVVVINNQGELPVVSAVVTPHPSETRVLGITGPGESESFVLPASVDSFFVYIEEVNGSRSWRSNVYERTDDISRLDLIIRPATFNGARFHVTT